MSPYSPPTPATDAFTAARGCFEQILTRLSDPQMMGATAQAVEQYVTTAGRDLQRQLIQDHLDARATAETRRAQVVGADEVTRRRAESDHSRLLATTVGRVQVTRIAYRAPGASNLHPADAQLSLPGQLYSYPLQQQVACQVAAGSLRAAHDTLARGTGQTVGTRQLMSITVDAAADVRAFYQQSTPPAGATPQDLLVASIDATAVTMIPTDLRTPTPPPPPQPRPPSAQLSTRERTGRARMACVTAIFDATPAPRTAADVLPATANERANRRPGPTATNRRVDASVQQSTAPMVAALFDTAQARDPHHRRRWIILVDGDNHQLDCITRQAHDRGIHVDIIVDFIHVLEYLWKAAEDLHPTHPSRAAFVHTTARDLLDGHAPQVIADLSNHLAARTAAGDPAPGLQRTIAYLRAKQPYLNYHIALALGWPIATGVIEGCCRYLVKDRLAITGARWSTTGAEAVLLLRAVITNGDFDTYWNYHLQQEHQRTHASRYQSDLTLAA